jgi:hypothetical protein
MNLFKGIATLNLQLPEDANAGDSYEMKVEVNDPGQIRPFTNVFSVNVLEPMDKSKGGKKGERKPPSKKGTGEHKQPGALGIPEVVEVDQEEWPKHLFDRESAIKLRQGENEYYFLCNIDNVYLKNEQKIRKSIDSELLKEQFKYGLALISLALLNEHEKSESKKNIEQNNDNEESIDDEIYNVTKAMSPFILPIVRELGSIDN